jgi:HD-like signal output (HDOD) protein/tRNA A-37 threonylcarbamoyl transferase component Bud32
MPRLVQDLRGRILGRYRLVTELGSGGMGAVYYGEHVSIGRRAAVKVLDPALGADEEVIERFFTEARAINALHHPNIVEVIDLAHEGEFHYLVMELLEGETLGARLERVKRLELAALVAIARPVASALEAVHAKGMVHRDLKPENIFLARDGQGRERPTLLDFGVVKVADGDTPGRTRAGLLLGTPAYMSPEQCAGLAQVDARSDVYSFGAVAYEAITGRRPFVRGNVLAVLSAHQCETPLAPSRLVPELSTRVSSVILRALAKSPDERYASAVEFAEELARAAEDSVTRDRRLQRKRITQTRNVGSKLAEIVGQRIAQGTLALPSMPEVCAQCLELLRVEPALLAEVADRVCRDPLLAARILTVARPRDGARVADVETALERLGVEAIRAILAEMAARQVFVSRDPRLRERLRAIWERSIALSLAAARLVDEVETTITRGEAQSAGLLAEIGHPILAALLLDVERSSSPKEGEEGSWITDEVFAAVVAEHGGPVGAKVATQWGLDPEIVRTIEGLDEWDDEPGTLRDLVRLAAELASEAGYLGPGGRPARDAVAAAGRLRFGLAIEAQGRIVGALPLLVREQLGGRRSSVDGGINTLNER